MEKAELEALVAKALKEHPEVFPHAKHIANMLKTYNINVGYILISKNLDLVNLQLDWINSCPDMIFFKNFSKNIFKQADEKCKEAVKERFQRIVETELEKTPEFFPGSSQIAELLKKDGIKVHAVTIFRNFNLSVYQLKWIKSCSDEILLENISKKRFNNMDEKCKKVLNERFNSMVEIELKNNPEIFPSVYGIMELLKTKYKVDIGEKPVFGKLDLPALQLKWIKSCSEKVLFENFSKNIFTSTDKRCRRALNEKLKIIVEAKLKNNPEIFPNYNQISELLKKEGVIDGRRRLRVTFDLPPLQIHWINSCSEKVFFENFSERRLTRINKKCKRAVKERLKRILETEIANNLEIFPSSPQILKLLKKYTKKITIAGIWQNLDIRSMQLKWIKSCSDEILLINLKKNRFNALDENCCEILDERIYKILLSNINELDSATISPGTLNRYFKKFPDLAFLVAATHEHKFTIDQKIVLDMHIWKETRSEELHKLIGERLEQLWAFRELFALTKDGRCLNADVISTFHETLPEKITGYIPDAAIRHSFVDELRNGDFAAGRGKDVLLLSFMHWLTEKQTAEILLRLNTAVGADNTIFMTSPNGLEYSSELIRLLNDFGFTPEKIGTLYLLPPDVADGQEQRKLLTKSKVLQFRKMKDVEIVPEKAELFSGEKKKGGGERPEPTAEIISYDKDMLKRAIPLISMRNVTAVFLEEVPEVKKVETEKDMALLELNGRVVVGFNVNKEHPYSIEIEGTRIPKGTDNAILDVMNGKAGFMIGEGMKGDYKKFLELIREKREKIGAVRKTLLKQK